MALINNILQRLSNIKKSYKLINGRKDPYIENIPFIKRSFDCFTYEMAVDYFTCGRPIDNSVKKMLIKCKKENDKYLISFLFLDSNEKVIINKEGILYGRQLIANSIDKEFVEMINNKKGLIVE